MEKIKQSLAVKVAAFILLLLFLVMTVISALIIGVNVTYNRYGVPEQKIADNIYHEIAGKLSYEIAGYYESKRSDSGYYYESYPGIFNGSWEGIGYKINKVDNKANNDELPIIMNKPLADNPYYTETFSHSDSVQIDVFMGKVSSDKNDMPPELISEFNLSKSCYDYRNAAIVAGVIGLIGTISLFVFLLCIVGKRKEGNPFSKIPLDLLAGILYTISFTFVFSVNSLVTGAQQAVLILLTMIMAMAVPTIVIAILLAIEVKAHTWISSTIICRVLKFAARLCKRLYGYAQKVPLVPRTAAIVTGVFIVNFFLVVSGSVYVGDAILLAVILWILVCAFTLYVAIGLAKLKEAGIRLAEGDLSYRVDKNGLRWGLADHADSLNNISRGMAKAVDEKMRSERFKAELITNVSHDIKTPLTSIISYVDFLKREDLDNEKAREYIEVLDRQSQRLKKLTEDLVEASKAATGNVQMELGRCEVGILMTQTIGEYEEKAKTNELNFVVRAPEEDLEIMADGRRLWRVFDNLLNNICKYSQPGTRVYLTLEEVEGKAVITYKNTSKYELNITGDELTERFIRGDRSRHTEGSGLGLSIARNLVELQGGTLDITVDGDLFKVIIKFQLA